MLSMTPARSVERSDNNRGVLNEVEWSDSGTERSSTEISPFSRFQVELR